MAGQNPLLTSGATRFMGAIRDKSVVESLPLGERIQVRDVVGSYCIVTAETADATPTHFSATN